MPTSRNSLPWEPAGFNVVAGPQRWEDVIPHLLASQAAGYQPRWVLNPEGRGFNLLLGNGTNMYFNAANIPEWAMNSIRENALAGTFGQNFSLQNYLNALTQPYREAPPPGREGPLANMWGNYQIGLPSGYYSRGLNSVDIAKRWGSPALPTPDIGARWRTVSTITRRS